MVETPEAGQFIWTRGLPKTGQTIAYSGGDDGAYEKGWWRGRENINNRIRFIAKTIGGDDIVIDRATGLMWAADGNAAGCNNGAALNWGNAILCAEALNFAGFWDWYLPNVNELSSIVDRSITDPCLYVVFINQKPLTRIWTSTTNAGLVTQAWCIHGNFGSVANRAKTDTYSIRCVRSLHR